MAFGVKTGGRQKGTPNKSTVAFRQALTAAGFSIPDQALELYEKAGLPNGMFGANYSLQLRILQFLAEYSTCKPTEDEQDDPYDVTPEEETLSESELLQIASGSSHAPTKSAADSLEMGKPTLETAQRTKKARRNPKKG